MAGLRSEPALQPETPDQGKVSGQPVKQQQARQSPADLEQGNVHLAQVELDMTEEIEPGIDDMEDIEGGPQPDEAGEDYGPEAVGHGLGEQPHQGHGYGDDAAGVKSFPGPVEMSGNAVGNPDKDKNEEGPDNPLENRQLRQLSPHLGGQGGLLPEAGQPVLDAPDSLEGQDDGGGDDRELDRHGPGEHVLSEICLEPVPDLREGGLVQQARS